MNVREKLVELLFEYFDIGDSYAYNLTRVKSAFACGTMGFDDFEEFDEETVEDIAAHLIAHGVTVQEWISVKDRLPDNICPVLVVLEGISTAFNGWYHDGKWWTVGAGTRPFTQKVTHWMPCPQPPKGE